MRASVLLFVVCAVLSFPVAARASLRAQPADPVAVEDARSFAETIAEQSTRFETDRRHAGRAHNVALAASLLDGAVIEPGATFSFNERIGERTLDAGFAVAPELSDGQVHEGVGGGVCQVATTLHMAAIESGFEIVEHRVHSIPSRYAPIGLDATVYYGLFDFRIQNPHAFPVRVRATTSEGVLVVRLEGAEQVERATIETRVIRPRVAPVQTVVDASLAHGERVVDAQGRDGMVVRIRATRGGAQSDRIVRYATSPRIVRVGA